ncbi:MAG: ATP-binding protein [Gammaproteobacteria bacterium]|nr:ATP-binding protein [Gammaproteobacteria bacterium]
MIAKPFIERFRASTQKASPSKSAESEKLLQLFQLSNQIESNELAVQKLIRAIFRVFNPSFILISSNSNNSLKINQAWQNSPQISQTTDITGKPASSLCELVKSSKQTQSINNVPDNYPNDPLLQKLGCQTYAGFPIFNNDNNIVNIISIISPRNQKYTQFELEMLNSISQRISRELSTDTSRIASQNEAILDNSTENQLKAELEAANKTIESISYTISHDLRAPLRSMDSFSQLLTEDFSSNLPEEALNYLNRIRRAAKRMGSMIDDLLWLSKVTRRKLERQEMDLSKLAINVLNEIKEQHSEYNCELSADPRLIISADKHLMKIALQHLLSNACKFSRDREKISITLSCFDHKGKKAYKITDNGCGFNMNYYDQLFEPFKKLHNDSDFEGTGIGLATVKRIIQRHGGEVWADSEPDEGTSIFFTLETTEETALKAKTS